ncbi:MAG: hypothetical protein H6741_20545 [Alphaproteobacteria bacterium]|nr:hypothetical protein [Alphaproteobacteria bacterium]MCB9795098.1 hypothetical protein [Alphaproteobacteria bacterium]
MDRTWRLPWRRLDLARFTHAAETLARRYDIRVEVEEEEADCHTAFFLFPEDPEDPTPEGGEPVCELSLYDLEGGVIVLSLEPDAGDNEHLGDAADQAAEDLAELLDAWPFDD